MNIIQITELFLLLLKMSGPIHSSAFINCIQWEKVTSYALSLRREKNVGNWIIGVPGRLKGIGLVRPFPDDIFSP